jgi:hypothetical protein
MSVKSKKETNYLFNCLQFILSLFGLFFIYTFLIALEEKCILCGIKTIESEHDLILPSYNKIVYNKQLCTETEQLSAKSLYSESCHIHIYKCNTNEYVAQYKTNQTIFKTIPFYMADNQQLIKTSIVSKVLLYSPTYEDCNCQTELISCNEPFTATSCIYIISNGLIPSYYVRYRIKFQTSLSIFYEHATFINGENKMDFYKSLTDFNTLKEKTIAEQCFY